MIRMKCSFNTVVVLLALIAVVPVAAFALDIGVARVDITPPWQQMKVQLGGYGDREGKPAEGVHDPVTATAIVLKDGQKKVALVGADMLFIPASLKQEVLKRIAGTGLDSGSLFMSAAHDHSGVEGMAMNRNNVFNNKHIGVFTDDLLLFNADKIAECIRGACSTFVPARVSVARTNLPGLNRNRRGDSVVDDELTVAEFESADGKVLAVLANWTAHPTILGGNNMLISGEWPGYMQRYVSAHVKDQPVVLYTNGAEGNQSVASAQGATAFDRVQNYGERIGKEVVNLLDKAQATDPQFDFVLTEIDLPPQKVSATFKLTAGAEYGISETEIEQMAGKLFPSRAPIGVVRIGDLALMYVPGEPIAEIGLAMKKAARDLGFKYAAVVGLSNDLIGYILTPEEYRQGGYEAAVSFYGEELGPFLVAEMTNLVANEIGK